MIKPPCADRGPFDPQLRITDTPRSELFNDVYHSRAGARLQAEQVYLQGIDFPARWRGKDRCRLLELGFGLGGNFLATLAAWRTEPEACKEIFYIAVEAYPLTRDELAQVQAQRFEEFADVADIEKALIAQWPNPAEPGFHHLFFADRRVHLLLIFEPVLKALTALDIDVDAAYLDGFAPQRNPEMWSDATLRALVRLLKPDAMLASYCVAGDIRRRLATLGIDVRKRVLQGPKREALQGVQKCAGPALCKTPPVIQSIAIIGAGVVGLTQALALARAAEQLQQHLRIHVFDRAEAPMQQASAAPLVLLHPPSGARDSLEFGLQLYTYRHALQTLYALQRQGFDVGWRALPVHELRKNGRSVWHMGYTLQPDKLRDALIAAIQQHGAQLQFSFGHDVVALQRSSAGITLQVRDGAANQTAPAFDVALLCNALAAGKLLPELATQIDPITGQLEVLRNPFSQTTLPHAYCGALNVLPDSDRLIVGNSFEPNQIRTEPSGAVRSELLERAGTLLVQDELHALHQRSWVGVRAQASDRRPLVGLFDEAIWLNVAHGSKGFSSAFLCAEIICDELLRGGTARLPTRLRQAIAAGRLRASSDAFLQHSGDYS